MNRTGLIVAIAVAFVVGSSLGLAAGVLVSRFAPPPGPPFGPPYRAGREGPPREMRRASLMPRLERALDLEPAQRERIEIVLRDARLGHEAVRETMKVKVERELTPEQLARWKQIESRFPSTGRRGGPPPPPDADRP